MLNRLNLCWGVVCGVLGGLEKGWVFLRVGSSFSGTPASSEVMRLTMLAGPSHASLVCTPSLHV